MNKEQFIGLAKKQSRVIIQLESYIHDLKFFWSSKVEQKEFEAINLPQFKVILDLVERHTILLMNSLLSKSKGDKLRLEKILNLLVNERKKVSGWGFNFDRNQLNAQLNSLTEFQNSTQIKNVRDSLIAHLDDKEVELIERKDILEIQIFLMEFENQILSKITGLNHTYFSIFSIENHIKRFIQLIEIEKKYRALLDSTLD